MQRSRRLFLFIVFVTILSFFIALPRQLKINTRILGKEINIDRKSSGNIEINLRSDGAYNVWQKFTTKDSEIVYASNWRIIEVADTFQDAMMFIEEWKEKNEGITLGLL